MATFKHAQTAPSTSWVIQHNLGYVPNVDVMVNYGGNLEKILPKTVIANDVNTITVEFSSAQTGMATLG